ncbi:MAG: nucleotidyltransferase domain-containing protein [Anaerolineae bacterium]
MADHFVEYWKRQQARRRHQDLQLAGEARRDLGRIVQILREDYGVRQVILFGSLARNQFTAGSDIDLAVAGLAPADFFTAWAEINRLSRFRIDLKPMESLYPHFRQRVLSRGEIIYEAPEGG